MQNVVDVLRGLARPFLAALLGGAIVAVILPAAGVRGPGTRTTIVVRQRTPSAATSGGALTPREIYARDAPGVVYVTATVRTQTQSPFNLTPSSGQGTLTGSGFVISRNGTILTNAHVIAGAVKILVGFERGGTVAARVLGRDPDDDLALLKVDPHGLDLVPLALGNSTSVAVGDPTVAIGNPYGLSRTLTSGVVSALQREIQAPNGFYVNNVIQTDAPINPGNSGGPLIDARGKVIGVNSQLTTSGASGGSVGIGFAIPINTAKPVIGQLERTGRVRQGYLGISTATVDASLASLHLGAGAGALIEGIIKGSPAARAHLRGGSRLVTLATGQQLRIGGDIVVSIDGRPVGSAGALENLVIALAPGASVRVGFVRARRHLTVMLRLGTRPSTLPSSG